jgi:YggT family protein
VSHLSCTLGIVIGKLLQLFWLAMIVYALVSWVPSLRGRWSDYLARIVEPVLQPVRRVIPPIGGLDVAFLVVIVLVSYLAGAIPKAACAYYY